MSEPLSIVAFNAEAGQVMANDGTFMPVTNWFDGDGEPCSPNDAVAFVAGVEGAWFTLRVDDFGGTRQ